MTREHNDKLVGVLKRLAVEIETGDAARNAQEAYTAGLMLYVQLGKDALDVDVASVLGALELSKARVLHRWNEIITKSNMENGG